MSEYTGSGGAIGGRLGAYLARIYFPGLFHKIGITQLPTEEVDRISTKNYPKSYKYYYVLLLLTFFLIWLSSMFAIMFFSDRIVQSLFFPNFIYFYHGDGTVIMLMVYLFGSILIIGSLVYSLFWSIASNNLKDYLVFKSIQQGFSFNYQALNKFYLIAGIVYFVILSPLLFLSFNTYTGIADKNIVQNNFFNIKEDLHPFDQIKEVTIKAKLNSEDNYFIESYAYLLNGKDIRLGRITFKTKEYLIQNGVNVKIERPNGLILKQMGEGCINDQLEDYALFDLNIMPVKNYSVQLLGLCF